MAQTRGSRPFPIDTTRHMRCMTMLAERGMTISDLAHCIGIARPNLSAVIHGRLLSNSYEARIAAFFGVPREQLFPRRTQGEIAALRKQEEHAKALAAKKRASFLAWKQSQTEETV